MSHILDICVYTTAVLDTVFVLNSMGANVILILYNRSINKKLVWCCILEAVLSLFAQFATENFTFKTKAELVHVSTYNDEWICFKQNRWRIQWMKNESGERFNGPFIKDSHLLNSWMIQPFEWIEWMNHSMTYSLWHLSPPSDSFRFLLLFFSHLKQRMYISFEGHFSTRFYAWLIRIINHHIL